MSRYNRVTIDSGGFINRHRTKKKLRPRRIKHDFKASEQPKTHSHLIADTATMKGVNPVMRRAKERIINLNHTELIYDSVKLPIDHRCHPAIKTKS